MKETKIQSWRINWTHTNNPIWWKLIFRTSKIVTKASWKNRVKRKRNRKRSRKRMKEESILIPNIKWPFNSWWLNSTSYKQKIRKSKHLSPKRRNLEWIKRYSKDFSLATMTSQNNGKFAETSNTKSTPSSISKIKCLNQSNQKPTNGLAYFDLLYNSN